MALLAGYQQKFPENVFAAQYPITLARVQLQDGHAPAALATLNAAPGLSGHSDYLFLKARALLLTGDAQSAAQLFRRIYKEQSNSTEAKESQQQLATLGATGVVLTLADRHAHAEALYSAHHYEQAEQEFRSIAADPEASPQLRADVELDAAACAYKLKRLTRSMLEGLPDTQDDHGAERLYLLTEDARNRNDEAEQRALVAEMEQRFPQSHWTEEALLSSGNMYFLARAYAQAIDYFSQLLRYFPDSGDAGYAHWKTAWLNYRLGNFQLAGRLFDEHITRYAGDSEVPDALYWRGRELEEHENAPARAKAYYQALATAFRNYYFGELAAERLKTLTSVAAEPSPVAASVHGVRPHVLSDRVPPDDVHVVRARLLGNAGLNEYIAREIRLSPDSADWADYAEVQIYAQAGETYRALRVAKRITPSYYAVPIDTIPVTYWNVLFPKPYFQDIRANCASQGLDPYLVLSLMRQESEFNPSVVSYANAYGLMQLLPSTGHAMARKAGMRRFSEKDLLNPPVNIELGTLYLKQTMDKFNGHVEYALAAYNAGDDRVQEWVAAGNFRDMAEFVESIPFTQTRDYVQAILRNERMYKRLNGLTTD